MTTSPKGTLLITGGSRGIGAETARLLAADGYDLCITYASQEDAARRVQAQVQEAGRRCAIVQADLGEPHAARELLQRIPESMDPLVGLVNNAGITGPLGPFLKTSHETMKTVLEVNVLSTLVLTQAVVAPWYLDGTKGSIVNVPSIAATLGAPGEYVHYAATKAAIEAFTVGLARELAESGIRVNAVSPGTTLTDIHATAGEPGRPFRVAARIPMRRPAQASEIAEGIVWLLGDRASYVTGTVLKVAGGL